MNDGGDFLARMVAALNTARVPHMVAGSFASTHYGAPRTTQDIDLVIDPQRSTLAAFVAGLAPEAYYVSEEAAMDALQRRSMFNVVDMATAWKMDLIVKKARPFSVEEFQRRVPTRVLGTEVFIASPEDVILSKLEWAADSGSARQLRDVAGVLAVQRDALDLAYIERWAAELGVLDRWRAVREA